MWYVWLLLVTASITFVWCVGPLSIHIRVHCSECFHPHIRAHLRALHCACGSMLRVRFGVFSYLLGLGIQEWIICEPRGIVVRTTDISIVSKSILVRDFVSGTGSQLRDILNAQCVCCATTVTQIFPVITYEHRCAKVWTEKSPCIRMSCRWQRLGGSYESRVPVRWHTVHSHAEQRNTLSDPMVRAAPSSARCRCVKRVWGHCTCWIQGQFCLFASWSFHFSRSAVVLSAFLIDFYFFAVRLFIGRSLQRWSWKIRTYILNVDIAWHCSDFNYKLKDPGSLCAAI